MTATLRCLRLLAFGVAAAWVGGSFAAGAPVAIDEPPHFAIERTGTMEQVVYSENVGELQNPVDKPTIEAICGAARANGLTDKQPRFEAGHDRPVATRNFRFSNSRQSANYILRHAYECDRPSTGPSSEVLCGCTYRIRIHRSVHIERLNHGRRETFLFDLDQRTVTRVESTARSRDPRQADAMVKALAPEVIGQDTIAGLPCVVRRQRLADKVVMDRCIVEDESKLADAELQYRTLSEQTPRQDGNGLQSWSRAVRIVPHALVDGGVFNPPVGMSFEGSAR
ncbi:MAG TPA: hypothetical protein VF169_04445 [Albitalea sp.]|uniref:hypothetical protein n=1 Tax=Piscinibacter sp. TaxID=1903157 RepID=UPI002ED17E0D